MTALNVVGSSLTANGFLVLVALALLSAKTAKAGIVVKAAVPPS